MLILAQQSASASLATIEPILFFLCAGLVVISAWAIVLSQNIVRMAVYLLLTLAGVAAFFFMLSAEFLAAIQLIVYAGGTLILIVFGVMLTSKNPFMQLKAQLWERGLGALLGGALAALLLLALVNSSVHQAPVATVATQHQVESIGKALLTDYLVPFEVAAVLLLIVMIGAAFMARKRAKG